MRSRLPVLFSLTTLAACGGQIAFKDNARGSQGSTASGTRSPLETSGPSHDASGDQNSHGENSDDKTKNGGSYADSVRDPGSDATGDGLVPLYPPAPSGFTLTGGHFDLDTSHRIYPFGKGTTDGHVHDYSGKYGLNGADFFALRDGALNALPKQVTDPKQTFVITIANARLSPGTAIEINGKLVKALDLQAQVDAAIAGTAPWPQYSLGESASDAVKRLTSFKVSFPLNVIPNGGLLASETGCVRANDPGLKSEYRNGALVLQVIDASKVGDIDPKLGVPSVGSSALLWEASVFWHWDGKCYGK